MLLLMKIAIGSMNEDKISAVLTEIVKDDFFSSSFHNDGFTLHSMGVPSGVRDQPLTLYETMSGARTRAMNVYGEVHDADFGFSGVSNLVLVICQVI